MTDVGTLNNQKATVCPCRHPISCTCIAHPKLDLLNVNGHSDQFDSKQD